MSPTTAPLPSPFTSFIGRAVEVALLVEVLAAHSDVRLVTITGTGGVGKTRLAHEAIAQVEHRFGDGVWLIDLASLQQGAQIAPRIAAVLGNGAAARGDPLETIVEFVRARQLLLVFDNCEHLLDDLAVVLNSLLLQCAQLRVVCTSREALHLPGEFRLALEPMPVIDSSTNPAQTALEEADVVRLFTDRAHTVARDFRITPDNINAVIEICRILDGIPLAIELAAAQVRIFSPHEIAQRLQRDLGFLTGGRSANARYHTLEAAIAWSEDLLSTNDRLLLHRMAIFADSALLATIETVCADALLPAPEILPALTRLVDKSLIITEAAGAVTRYRMLTTIKRVALIGLAQRAEFEAMTRRHAAWVWALAREAGAAIYSAASLQWVERLESENGNVRQAIAYGIAQDQVLAADIISNLAWYWLWRNYMAEATAWTQSILDAEGAQTTPRVRARMLYTYAMTCAWSYDFAKALAALEEAQHFAQRAEDSEILPRIRAYYAAAALYSGRVELAARILDEIDAANTGPDAPFLAANQLSMRGLVARESGKTERALALMEEGLRGLRALGEPFLLGTHIYAAARTYHMQGDIARADQLLRECHEIALRTRNTPLIVLTFFSIAEISQYGGRLAEALDWFEGGVEYMHGQGEAPGQRALCSLAFIAAGAELYSLALSLYAAAGVNHPVEKALPAFVDEPHRHRFQLAYHAVGQHEYRRAQRAGCYWSPADAIGIGLDQLRQSLDEQVRTQGPELKLRLLGPGQVLRDNKPLEMADWKYALARDLLFYLVTVGERTREQIVLDFWPDVDPAHARNRLNVTIHFMRKALGPRRWVAYENNRYRFEPVGPYSCDLDDFYAATSLAERVAQTHPEQAIASLEHAVSLVRGEFLEDIRDGQWHESFRVAIRRDYRATLLRLANLQLENNLTQNAVYTLSLALRADAFNEETYRCLMRAHLLRRDLVQVMQVYRHLSELLQEEFGAAPAPETVQIYTQIVAQLQGATPGRNGSGTHPAGNNGVTIPSRSTHTSGAQPAEVDH